jgi:TonB family protein
MGCRVLLAASVALASATAARADVQPQKPAPAPFEWTQTPSSEQTEKLFPKKALEVGLSGRTLIGCTIAADGSLSDCEVMGEQPTNLGFAQAAIEDAKLYRASPTDRAGAPTAGRKVRLRISWAMPGQAADMGLVFEAKGLKREPIPLTWTREEIPPAALASGARGEVLVRGVIGVDGRMSGLTVVESSRSPDLDQAAVAAFGRWTFSPGLDANGQPTTVSVTEHFVFDYDLAKMTCAEATLELGWYAKAFPEKTRESSRLYLFSHFLLSLKVGGQGPDALRRFRDYPAIFEQATNACASQPQALFLDTLREGLKP